MVHFGYHIEIATKFEWRHMVFLLLNPIPAGGGQFDPSPLYFFLQNSKKYWSEAVKIFWLFLHTQNPPFRPKTGL